MPAMNPDLTEILGWLAHTAPRAQLSSDSRAIAPGDVFLAYPGDTADGRKHISHAIKNGAQAVLYEVADFAWPAAWNTPHLAVNGLKKLAGAIASACYGQPDAHMFTVGVTGTNGKTSCTQWIANACSRLAGPTAVIGTLGVAVYRNGEHEEFGATGYTTPDAVLLQRRLSEMRDAGAQTLAIEASSIGLDQGRLNGMHFDAALFTNFTRDHLDYHGDMAAYEAAKSLLFDWPGLKHAIVNLDDEMGPRLIQRLRQGGSSAAITGYSVCGRAVEGIDLLRACDIRTSYAGTVFHVDSRFGQAQVKAQVVGQFNVSNLLGVIAVLLAQGIAWPAAIGVVEALAAVPGRMQQLGGEDAPLVVIDYAHTPDALEKTLASLRQVANERTGELWCVLGCGGDRDPGKRPQMGAAAAMAADHVVVTSDNPRSEDPAHIMRQIISGMKLNKTAHAEIEDRAAAILWAVKHAAKNDVVLLAGKGHETYQEIKGKKLPFLDADHAALALAARVTMKGAS